MNNDKSKISQIMDSIRESNYEEAAPLQKTSQDAKPASQRAEDLRKDLENKAFEQDMELKRTTLFRLFWFLGLETVVVFLLAFLQGFKLGSFSLDEWSFKLLISATLIQITYMLQVAVKHLFPDSNSSKTN